MVHGQRFDIEVGTVFRFLPEQVFRHQTFGVQFHAVQNDFLELFITGPVDEVTAVEILGLVIHDPCGEFLPVFQYPQNDIFRGPIEEHFSGTRCLPACAAPQNHPVELGFLTSPGAGGTDTDTLTAAYAAAGVLLHFADSRIGRQHPGGTVLTGPYAGAAGNAAFGMVRHACHTNNTEVA